MILDYINIKYLFLSELFSSFKIVNVRHLLTCTFSDIHGESVKQILILVAKSQIVSFCFFLSVINFISAVFFGQKQRALKVININ